MLIDVVLPLPLYAVYTYTLPEGQRAAVGARVLVPFGTKKTYTGIVYRIYPDFEERKNYKEAIAIFDEQPAVLPLQLKCWEWIADYHQCTLGEVYKVALPVKMKTGIIKRRQKLPKKKDIPASPVTSVNLLTYWQQQAYNSIKEKFAEQNVVLLHGITSSGKTEIYIHLIEETVRQGKQVLYLLPEIALTTQITERLRKVFGNQLGIYHSRMTDTLRANVWENLLGKEEESYQIILGVRSSVLLPFSNVGLIIIDEEHESSYKQYDPAPRYHARDTAIMLASLHGAKTLLGTATPSVETYRNVQLGKYALVELTHRHQDIALPNILVSDVKLARKRKQMKSHFSPLLLEKMREALSRKEQIILFQNRRGFAPLVECKQCAWVPRCKHCDVSLTYHKTNHKLSCHYCGAVYSLPAACPLCGSELETKGFGTEKIEEDIKMLFPQVNVARLDLDSTRKKNAYEQTIKGFEQGDIDILIGTQMITKGLDFERVSVVGILNADNMLNYPDFRSHERAFQLMTQVSGRAGRKGRQGTVILQTSTPEHPIIQQVINHDYKTMYAHQTAERETFRYPPFVRLVEITLKHKYAEKVAQASYWLANELKNILGNHCVLGPDNPAIARIQNFYLKHILLKVQNNHSLKSTKETMRDCINRLQKSAAFKSVIVSIDVDPL